jgi:hypothetical protein
MNVVFTINFTGTPDADDQLAARQQVELENQRRAALTPPGTPLDVSTGAAVKASYLTVLTAVLTAAHTSYIALAKDTAGLQQRFTSSEIQTIQTNLITRLNAGEAKSQIIADTASPGP